MVHIFIVSRWSIAVYQSDSFCGYKIHACMLWTIRIPFNDRNPTKIVDLKSRSKLSQSPQLATLPPTNEAFGSPPASSYLEACSGARPTIATPTSYGWEQDCSNSLMPTTVPEGTWLAPVQLLKLIRCSCESDMPCTKN